MAGTAVMKEPLVFVSCLSLSDDHSTKCRDVVRAGEVNQAFTCTGAFGTSSLMGKEDVVVARVAPVDGGMMAAM